MLVKTTGVTTFTVNPIVHILDGYMHNKLGYTLRIIQPSIHKQIPKYDAGKGVCRAPQLFVYLEYNNIF